MYVHQIHQTQEITFTQNERFLVAPTRHVVRGGGGENPPVNTEETSRACFCLEIWAQSSRKTKSDHLSGEKLSSADAKIRGKHKAGPLVGYGETRPAQKILCEGQLVGYGETRPVKGRL